MYKNYHDRRPWSIFNIRLNDVLFTPSSHPTSNYEHKSAKFAKSAVNRVTGSDEGAIKFIYPSYLDSLYTVADLEGGHNRHAPPPPPPKKKNDSVLCVLIIPFCIRMLKNKAQIARESIKTPGHK